MILTIMMLSPSASSSMPTRLFRPARTHRFTPIRQQHTPSDLLAEREAARRRAWYLPPPASPPPTPRPRQPTFTPFDPSSTLPTHLSPSPAPSLHPDAPHLKDLHAFLTTHPDAREVIVPSSVRFWPTRGADVSRWIEGVDQPQRIGRKRRSVRVEGELLGATGEAGWEWVGALHTRFAGKGAVARADKLIRTYVRRRR